MNIRDYMHLYLGCDCIIGDLNWKPETNLHDLAPGVDPNYGKPIKTKVNAHVLNVYSHNTTLLLRPLSDMTEDEKKTAHEIYYTDKIELLAILDVAHFELCRHLLSKGFDLFGLIDAGLAIDKTKY